MSKWKRKENKIGVYKIVSKINPQKCYVGSSVNIEKRFYEHKRVLGNNKHDSPKLQCHHNKYGVDDLEFLIIEECTKDKLIEREQFYIDLYNPWFNICLIAGNCMGRIVSDKTREKMSISRRKRPPMSEESRKKLSNSLRGRPSPTKGKKRSLDAIRKTAEKNRGKKRTEEFKKRMSEIRLGEKNYAYGKPAHNRGVKVSDDVRMKESIAQKKAWEVRRANGTDKSPYRKRVKMSEETKRKISQRHKGRRMSPDTEFKKGHPSYNKNRKIDLDNETKMAS